MKQYRNRYFAPDKNISEFPRSESHTLRTTYFKLGSEINTVWLILRREFNQDGIPYEHLDARGLKDY